MARILYKIAANNLQVANVWGPSRLAPGSINRRNAPLPLPNSPCKRVDVHDHTDVASHMAQHVTLFGTQKCCGMITLHNSLKVTNQLIGRLCRTPCQQVLA
jgi:hypothetical protein